MAEIPGSRRFGRFPDTNTVDSTLEKLINMSFAEPGSVEKLKQMVEQNTNIVDKQLTLIGGLIEELYSVQYVDLPEIYATLKSLSSRVTRLENKVFK